MSAHPTHSFNKHRVEAVSDGLFTIAMTLLAFNLKPPTGFSKGHVWYPLGQQWPTFLSFALTFGLAARFWALQHDVLEAIDRVGHYAILTTFTFLGLISLLPFTTSLLSAHFTDHSVMTLYLAHELAVAAMLPVTLEFCAWGGNVSEGIDLRSLRIRLYMLAASIAGCIVTTATLNSLYWLALSPLAFGLVERIMQKRALQK